MKLKAKKCSFGSCNNPAFSKGKCKWHMERVPMKRSNFESKSSTMLKAAPLKRESAKRAKQTSQYNKAAREFRSSNPECAVKVDGCTYFTQEVHHRKGRENDRLLDQEWWLPVCASCHRYIHSNSEEAYRNGWLVSK